MIATAKKGRGGDNARLTITSNRRNAGFFVTPLFLALESEGPPKTQRGDLEMESRRNLCHAERLVICLVGPIHCDNLRKVLSCPYGGGSSSSETCLRLLSQTKPLTLMPITLMFSAISKVSLSFPAYHTPGRLISSEFL